MRLTCLDWVCAKVLSPKFCFETRNRRNTTIVKLPFYHRFRWYATLENKIPAETFPKFPSVLRVIDRSNRNPPITATRVTSRPSLRHASGCDWWISTRSVDNMCDWRKFWKRFDGCFVFESRVSTKTVVKQFWLRSSLKTTKMSKKRMFGKKLRGSMG